jgi:hypothetical protein
MGDASGPDCSGGCSAIVPRAGSAASRIPIAPDPLKAIRPSPRWISCPRSASIDNPRLRSHCGTLR